ncbi:DNA-binding MarR family transcriptional regulator [Limimaricola soesokkakensis]|uniref:DNA-binding MarR family transcriptional regulator n=1 Tax=Limimaricola soesokkakensis TaxID=1343159 RepID=A0A1X6Y6F1_9RHOB|nr:MULTISPECIES: helix-turn-helix domain-containing protein [Limimaricola]MCZ4260355.1 helix-turn-helix domain-containing protein [Limimaricola sp. G21655-S1]PSK87304.1 DNA-binding MarR family transcriptional regulator [Limimaricola soesokkakensis]SLN12247.1 MarR family protein [Limimaricola soesokkakensis]
MALMDDPQRMADRLRALAELERRLSFRISRLSKLLDTHAARQLAVHGTGLTSYRILMVLGIFGETTAADLSRLMVIDRAQISRSVSDLLAQGLLEQRSDGANRRRRLLRLSATGQEALGTFEPGLLERQKVFEELLDAEELRGLNSAVDKITRYLAETLEAPDAAPVALRPGSDATG